MNALIIGSSVDLAGAVARGLRTRGLSVLQAIPSDAAGRDRIEWLLEEAGQPELIIVFEAPPYALVHELAGLTTAHVVLVAEQRAAVVGAPTRRSYTPRDADGLTVVALGRAGRRWFRLDARRPEPLGPERAAAIVLRSCGAEAASSR